MQERKLNIEMDIGWYEQFKSAANNSNKLEDFFNQFLEAYTEYDLNYEDILSLGLIQAIRKSDIEMVETILNCDHENNIFATIDKSNESPLFVFLKNNIHNQDLVDIVKNYLLDTTQYYNIPKIDLAGDSFIKMRNLIQKTSLDNMTIYDNISFFREDFLNHIYSEETLTHLDFSFDIDFSIDQYQKLSHNIYFKKKLNNEIEKNIDLHEFTKAQVLNRPQQNNLNSLQEIKEKLNKHIEIITEKASGSTSLQAQINNNLIPPEKASLPITTYSLSTHPTLNDAIEMSIILYIQSITDHHFNKEGSLSYAYQTVCLKTIIDHSISKGEFIKFVAVLPKDCQEPAICLRDISLGYWKGFETLLNGYKKLVSTELEDNEIITYLKLCTKSNIENEIYRIKDLTSEKEISEAHKLLFMSPINDEAIAKVVDLKEKRKLGAIETTLGVNKAEILETPINHISYLYEMHNKALLLMQKLQFDKAIHHLTEVLTVVEEKKHGEPFETIKAHTLNNLGVSCFAKGYWAQAFTCYEKALALRKRLLEENKISPKEVGDSYRNLANLYLMTGNFEKAVEYGKEELTLKEVIYGNQFHPDLFQTYKTLGDFCSLTGNHLNEALPYYNRALQAAEKLPPPQNTGNTITILIALGTLHIRSNELKKAEKCFDDVLKKLEDLGGEQHREQIPIYERMIHLYLLQNNPIKAYNLANKTLFLYDQFYSNQAIPSRANVFNLLGNSCSIIKNKEEAIYAYNEALKIRKTLYSPKAHLDVAIAYNNLAAAYYGFGHTDDAEFYYKKAIDILKEIKSEVGTYPLPLKLNYIKEKGQIFINLGNNYIQKGDLITPQLKNTEMLFHSDDSKKEELINTQIQAYDKGITIFLKVSRLLEKNNLFFSNLNFIISTAYKRLDNLDKALEYFEKVLKESDKFFNLNKSHIDYLKVIHYGGVLHLYHGNFEKSEYYFKKAIILIPAQNKQRVHEEFEALVRKDLGYFYLIVGKSELASTELKISLATLNTLFGPDHPETMNTKRLSDQLARYDIIFLLMEKNKQKKDIKMALKCCEEALIFAPASEFLRNERAYLSHFLNLNSIQK